MLPTEDSGSLVFLEKSVRLMLYFAKICMEQLFANQILHHELFAIVCLWSKT